MLALAAAINFCFARLLHRLRARDRREALGHERDLVLPRCSCRSSPASSSGAVISGRIAGRMDLVRQVRIGLGDHVRRGAGARAPAPGARPTCRSRCSRRCCSSPPSARSSRFPVLTLRMLDLFPAARGTAASAQSFVALLITAFTLGIVSRRRCCRISSGWRGRRSTLHVAGLGVLVFLAALARARDRRSRASYGLSALAVPAPPASRAAPPSSAACSAPGRHARAGRRWRSGDVPSRSA